MKFINLHIAHFALANTVALLFVSSCLTNNDSNSSVSTLTNTTPNQTFENVTYDENYMKDCKNKFPLIHSQQIGFREIYPGFTTEDQLIAQLGQPNKFSKTDEGEEYLYFDPDVSYAYHFFITNHVVSDIFIEADAETLSPLQNILEKYGCPDVIFAVSASDDPFDNILNYNRTFFVYLDAGIRIKFEGYPINYLDTPFVVGFVKPISLDDFLELETDSLASKSSVLITFLEAVK